MAFTSFKRIRDVQETYQIQHIRRNFIPDVQKEPPTTLVADLDYTRKRLNPFSSETARKENLIYPLLFRLYQTYDEKNEWNKMYDASDNEHNNILYFVKILNPIVLYIQYFYYFDHNLQIAE